MKRLPVGILALCLAGIGPTATAAAARGRRGGPAGRVVSEEALRRAPLPRPSGNLHIVNVNTREELKVNILNPDGSYSIEAMDDLNQLLRCRRTDSARPMEPRLLRILSHVYDHFGQRPIEVVSAYRNQRNQTSYHYHGKASDIRIVGVDPRGLRDFVATLDTGGMGLGIYPKTGFVHVDVRPLPSYRWLDRSGPDPNARGKQPPRGWKKKKLES